MILDNCGISKYWNSKDIGKVQVVFFLVLYLFSNLKNDFSNMYFEKLKGSTETQNPKAREKIPESCVKKKQQKSYYSATQNKT